MKFAVRYTGKSGRLGTLSNISKRHEETFATPALTMYTRGGNVPHITHEVLQLISTDSLIMHMPLTTIMTACSSIESFGRDLSEFVGLKEYPSYITPQDPAVQTPSGHNVSNKVAIWTKNGKSEIDTERYMKMVESMKPDMYLALCDGNTNSDSSKKRIIKSAARSLKMFEECYNLHQASPVLKNIALLAPLEGGYDVHARKSFTEQISKYDVSGYVLDGIHLNGADAECIKFSAIKAVVEGSLERLPEDKFRIAHGPWNPTTLLQLVAAGFDMFDTSLPYLSTERGAVLIFPYNLTSDTSQHEPNVQDNVEMELGSQEVPFEVCLGDERFAEDFQPVLKDCTCLTCKHHTRAYIHHLLKCQELLGRVLIMIHNLHHYLEFFKSIRRAVKNNCLESLCTLVRTDSAYT